jgi:hypothetical protein
MFPLTVKETCETAFGFYSYLVANPDVKMVPKGLRSWPVRWKISMQILHKKIQSHQ